MRMKAEFRLVNETESVFYFEQALIEEPRFLNTVTVC